MCLKQKEAGEERRKKVRAVSFREQVPDGVEPRAPDKSCRFIRSRQNNY